MMMRAAAVGALLLLTACGSDEPADPLATSENRTACETMRRVIPEHSAAFQGAGQGTQTTGDVAEAAGILQQEAKDAALYATGELGPQLQALSDGYGRIRVSITEMDVPALEAASVEMATALEQVDQTCEGIGE